MQEKTKPFLAIYKVVRSFKHKVHGWIKWGRFVCCTPLYAKNHVIRRELIRCSTEKQESVAKTALWIDSLPDPRKQESKQKPESKPKSKSKSGK